MLNDVCGAWNADKTVNLLVIKKTLLAPLLSSKAIPSSSPVCHGYVQWEHKRGKWQKRWCVLIAYHQLRLLDMAGRQSAGSVDGKTLPACHLASARRGNWRGNCFGVFGGWRMLASGERLRNW